MQINWKHFTKRNDVLSLCTSENWKRKFTYFLYYHKNNKIIIIIQIQSVTQNFFFLIHLIRKRTVADDKETGVTLVSD